MVEYAGRKVLLKDEDDNAIIPYVDGVIDSNTSNTVKTWTGTKAQYDALTKDSNTIYHITDDESSIINTINDLVNSTKNQFNTLLNSLYPVGSVYIGTQTSCPLATLISGSSWSLVSSGKALWTGNGSNANTTIDAGLPDHSHTIQTAGNTTDYHDRNGNAMHVLTDSWGSDRTTSKSKASSLASVSNSIYGKSSTVQPPAYVVNVWRRTA